MHVRLLAPAILSSWALLSTVAMAQTGVIRGAGAPPLTGVNAARGGLSANRAGLIYAQTGRRMSTFSSAPATRGGGIRPAGTRSGGRR